MSMLGVQTTTENFLTILTHAGFTPNDFQRMKIEEKGIELIGGQEFSVFALFAEDGPNDTVGKIEKILIKNNINFIWE